MRVNFKVEVKWVEKCFNSIWPSPFDIAIFDV